jgi:hypothetical protein
MRCLAIEAGTVERVWFAVGGGNERDAAGAQGRVGLAAGG